MASRENRDNRLSVFVGNLPQNILQSHFDHIFPNCKISNVRLVRDRETDEFRGYGYVEFEDEASLRSALETDGAIVEGRQIRVNHASDRRGGRGGRGGVAPRGGMGNGIGRGGYGRGGNFDHGGTRGRQSMNPGGRYGGSGSGGGGPSGRGNFGRPSYQPSGPARSMTNRAQVNFNTRDVDSSSSSDDRPKLNLKPRTLPARTDDRELSERSRAIFGVGRPREASPIRNTDSNIGNV